MPIPLTTKEKVAHLTRVVKLMGVVRDEFKHVFPPVNVGTADGFERHEQNPVIAQVKKWIQRMSDLDPSNAGPYSLGVKRIAKDFTKWVNTTAHGYQVAKKHPAEWKRVAAAIQKLADEVT